MIEVKVLWRCVGVWVNESKLQAELSIISEYNKANRTRYINFESAILMKSRGGPCWVVVCIRYIKIWEEMNGKGSILS